MSSLAARFAKRMCKRAASAQRETTPDSTVLNVSHSHKCTTCHSMCHPTLDVSKNVKFQLSRNLTKFDGFTRFWETNSTVKSVLSSEN